MIGIIPRDYFSDPDVLCKHLRLYQHDACHWFCELFLMSFRNKEIDREAARNATSREEFILTIRGRDLLGNLEDAARLLLLTILVLAQSSITMVLCPLE